MILPRHIALVSKLNDKYLRFIRCEAENMEKWEHRVAINIPIGDWEDQRMEEEQNEMIKGGKMEGLLKFCGESVMSPHSKFEVEPAKCDSQLVHIRCCSNNKYWVAWSNSYRWIVAEARAPEEDKLKWSCTLFQPEFDTNQSAFRFRHVEHGSYVKAMRMSESSDAILFGGSLYTDFDLCNDLFTIVNWELCVFLPKHVAFKSDNGHYLMALQTEGWRSFLQFHSDNYLDPRVSNETFITPTAGYYRIKSYSNDKFWRCDRNEIWVDSDVAAGTSSNDLDTLFLPVKLDDDHVALFCLGNKKYIKRLARRCWGSSLNASGSTITIHTRFKIEEPVVSRAIYNVEFHLSDARIYCPNTVVLAIQEATNRSSQPKTIQLKFSHTDTKTSSWEASASLKLAAQTNLRSGIPFIADGKVQISTEFSGSYKWGETRTTSKTLETTITVTVPPMKMTTVRLLATQGYCDVPFSYTQHDLLSVGRQVTYHLEDGVYTGVSSYYYNSDTTEIPLC